MDLDVECAKKNIGLQRCSAMKIKVVLTSWVQTSWEQYTHIFKTVEVDVPDDGNEWHVAGEEVRV